MKKIIGIFFSPRKMGNCEIAIKELINNFPQQVSYEILRIYDFDIKPCRACYSCLFGSGDCVIDDDFMKVFEKVVSCDGLIFAVPSYFLGPNSAFKVFIDRFLTSYKYYEKIDSKPVILITIAGVDKGGEGYTDLALKSTARVIGFNVVGSSILYAALPGEVVLNEDNVKVLKSLAKSMFDGEKKESFQYFCNICGSNYFEFMDKNYIKCLVCKNRGRVLLEEDGSLSVHIEESGELFFGSKEAKLKHKEWLKSMKERFFKEKKRLMEVIKRYKS